MIVLQKNPFFMQRVEWSEISYKFKNNITIPSEDGYCTDSHLMNAAHGTKYDFIKVGCTMKKLNKTQWPQTQCQPQQSLRNLFFTNDCNLKEHLMLHILKNIPYQPTLRHLNHMEINTYADYKLPTMVEETSW